MNYFVVFQNQTFKQEHDLGILWAPQKDKSGGIPKFHWTNMVKLRKGDIVFSVVKNQIKARGIVIEEAIDKANPFENDLWIREGWLVKIDYNFSLNRMLVKEHIDEIRHMLPDKYSAFRKKDGYGNQGYLFEITKELGEYFDEHIIDTYKEEDFSTIFDTDLDTSNIIRKVFEEEGINEGEVILVETERPKGTNIPKNKRKSIQGRKVDFLKKARRDAAVGQLAEELVLTYEKTELQKKGLDTLADNVKWVAKKADGFGYDVLSFNEDGTEKYIEVKATTMGKKAPFYISSNEVKTSLEKKENYWIYRVYYIDDSQPKFYKICGSVEDEFVLEPTSYKAYFKH